MTLHLLYGGTFDPVHIGHLAMARAAHDRLDAPIHVMPAGDPAHRAPPGASAEQRAAMLDLAVADVPWLSVDRREIARGDRSYTVDTLLALREDIGPQAPVAMLIGADSFLGLPSWKHWQMLFDLAHVIVAERPGSPLDGALPARLAEAVAGRWVVDAALLGVESAGRLLRLAQPEVEVSASDIRRRIAAGRPWQSLVPDAVAGYITAHRLYLNSYASGPGHGTRADQCL